jgi:hypothetical protein
MNLHINASITGILSGKSKESYPIFILFSFACYSITGGVGSLEDSQMDDVLLLPFYCKVFLTSSIHSNEVKRRQNIFKSNK